MHGADNPEEAFLPKEPEPPALTIDDCQAPDQPDLDETPNSQNAPEEAKQGQSVFSNRSGIQDLLVKPDTHREKSPTALKISTGKSAASSRSESSGNPAEHRKAPHPKPLRPAKSKRQLERVRRRQKNYLEQRREEKRRKFFYQRIRLLFKLCFALLLGTLLWELLQSPLWVYQEPRFDLRQGYLIREPQLRPLIQEWVGKPIYLIDVGKIAHTIEEYHPIVEQALVRRQMFPARLTIILLEKQPWAEFYPGLDAQGHLFKPYALGTNADIISLKGYQYPPPGTGIGKRPLSKIILPPKSRLSPDYLQRLRKIAWQSQQIKGLRLNYIDARNLELLELHYQETRVILGRPDTSASKRLARLIPLAPKIMEFQEALESVDLRWAEQVTFHKKPNQKIGPELAPKEPVQG